MTMHPFEHTSPDVGLQQVKDTMRQYQVVRARKLAGINRNRELLPAPSEPHQERYDCEANLTPAGFLRNATPIEARANAHSPQPIL
jgi:hypothetical protein